MLPMLPWRNMLIGAALLGAFAVVGTGMVTLTHELTEHRIEENERDALLANFHAVISPESHDNELHTDRIEVRDELLGKGVVDVYRARLGDVPTAVLMTPSAPDGYSGAIRLLVAINHDGTLSGVRVLKHRETPGLGDKIEAQRSDWILGFAGLSLGNPETRGWAVKKDGGEFDLFTGATITPRAVVGAVHRALLYYRQHREALFVTPAIVEVDEDDHEPWHGDDHE